MRVINFRNVKIGTLVTRSAHWNREHGINSRKKEIGIITDLKFFTDKVAGVVCYPVIHWEGGIMASMTHPVNVNFYRKQAVPPTMIDIDPES